MFNTSLVILFFYCCLGTASSQNKLCTSISGAWFNELGSKIELGQSVALTGRFWTAVERTNGTSGSNHSNIFGTVLHKEPGSVFGFSVMWRGGQSMTSWTGQCLVCGNEEVLVTSWLLRSRVDNCLDKWKSTLIGENIFTRTQQIIVKQQNNRKRRHLAIDGVSFGNYDSADDGNTNRQACSVDGLWYNALGSEMILTTNKADNSITGEYRTAVERCKGSAGSAPSSVYGLTNSTQTDSTISLFVVWNHGKSVTGWVGQCHPCGVNGSEVLMMTWLLRSKIDACEENWKATNYGETVFTRHEHTSGPRRRLGTHSPGQAGEIGAKRQAGTCRADVTTPTATLLLLSLFYFFLL